MARKKKATKKATKKASPKRRAPPPKKQATQLQVLTQAREFMAKKHPGQTMLLDELDNTVPGYISTQSLAIDWIIGNGGVPQSRIVDITGDEGVGKSTLGDHLMSQVQLQGGHAWIWDTENARDNRYQDNIGIIRKRAGQIGCHTMEDGFEVMIDLLSFHAANDPLRPGIILWDTVAGTPTRNEANPEKTDERFGPAKIIRSYLRKLNQILQQTRWVFVAVNQTYRGQSPGGQGYTAVYGGGGFPFYASIRLQVSHPAKFWRTTTDKDRGLPPLGVTPWVRCIKSRVSPPHKSKQICIEFGQGIDNTWSIHDSLKGAGAIVEGGGWYGFDPGYGDLAERFPGKWQGGYLGLKEKVKEQEGLWEALIESWNELEVNSG